MSEKINLKYDAEYASEVMSVIPAGYVDKTICGCGLTTVALENDEDVIIAVPTIYLAINKSEQYPNERCSHNILSVWGETTGSDIEKYMSENKVIKIMVTYDGLGKVSHLLGRCRLIVDESNEILKLTKGNRAKSAQYLFSLAEQYKKTVSFISATPTDLKYMPNWMSELSQVKIEWSNTVKSTPILCERTYPFKSLREEFLIPLKRNDNITVAGKTFSKVIVFINSVAQISEIIKDAGIDKTQCGIICGDSLKNDTKIVGIKRYSSGVMPKFLFITASGFCGIDLKDNNAMTIVVSNTAKNWQMIDMLTDLKQAVSRQRDKSNPNYGSYIYIYNQTVFKMSKEELLSIIDIQYSKISNSIKVHTMAVDNDIEDGFEPSEDFKTYTIKSGKYYIINEEAFSSDKYFILEIRDQYTRGFDINAGFNNAQIVEPISLPNNLAYKDLVEYFKENHSAGVIDWGIYSTKNEWISIIEASYKFYKKVWINYTEAKQMVDNYGDSYELIKIQIKKLFITGDRYTRKDVKDRLQALYNSCGVARKAKHTDLNEVMQVRELTVKGERMIEIIKK